MIESMTDIVIGARSLGPWRQLGELLGYRVLADAPDTGTIGEGARSLLLAAPGTDSGRLRIIEFPNAPARERTTMGDLGPFDVNLYTLSLTDAHAALTAAGYASTCPPGSWQLASPPLSIRQALYQGPDGVNLMVVEGKPSATGWQAAWRADQSLRWTEITSAVTVVDPDIENSLHFWTEGMGMEVLLDFTVSDPYVEQMLGLAAGVPLRMIALGHPDTTARAEIVTVPGDLLDRTSMIGPNCTGIIAWGFRTTNLGVDLEQIIIGGGKLERSIRRVDDRVHGKATTVTVRSVDNTLLELWQPD